MKKDLGAMLAEAATGPAMRAYDPTWRDQIGGWLFDHTSGSPEARRFVEGLIGSTGLGNTGASVADFTPGLGQALQAQDAYAKGDAKGMAQAVVPVPGANIAGKVAAAAGDAGASALANELAGAVGPASQLAQRVMDNWGSKHAFEAKNAAKVEQMGERAFSTAGRQKTQAVSPTILREMAREQGDNAVLDYVRGGKHLKPDGTGGYIGAPRTIDSPQALGALRRKLDTEVANSIDAVNLGDPERMGTWYARAKGGMEASNEPWQLQRTLDAHGAYSAGVSPESELGFSLKHHNSRALGEPTMAFRSKPMENLDNAAAASVPAKLADKTDEYRSKLDPRNPVAGLFGVNDFRAAQNFGYTNKQGKPWKAAVTGTMHPFMDGETALVADRMNARAAGGSTDWNGPQMQELPWVYGKAQDLYKRGANARFAGDPLEGRMSAIREANNTFEDYLAKHAAAGTYELVPGNSTGHAADVLGMSDPAKQDYGRVGRWDRQMPSDPSMPNVGAGNRDAIYSALGLRQLPTTDGWGAYRNMEGVVEGNPVKIARPLADFPTGGNGGSMAPLTEGAIDAAENFRGVIDAQEAYAYNLPNTMAGAKAKTGVLLDTRAPGEPHTGVQPDKDTMAALNAAAGEHGFGATATGRGVLAFPFSGRSTPRQRNAVQGALGEILPGANPMPARPNTGYGPALGQWDPAGEGIVPTEPYSGQATTQVLNKFVGLPQTVSQNLAESEAVRSSILAKKARDEMLGARGDIQNTRQFFADGKWPGVVDLMRKGVPPAAAMAAFGYSIGAMAGEQPQR